MKNVLYTLLAIALLMSCSSPQIPAQYKESQVEAPIYPDYQEVTVPVNMAPLNFELLMQSDKSVIRLRAANEEIICEGPKVRPDIDDWKGLLEKAQGGAITVEVFASIKDQWVRFKPFNIYVSADPIDPWLSYRLISPSYVSYEELTLNQRCLENFDDISKATPTACSFMPVRHMVAH